MAQFDSAYCLAALKALLNRPATDESLSDANAYLLLELAQTYWTGVFAAQIPWVLMSAPVTLTTADNGLTYTFPGGIYPLAVELYDTTTPARLLRPGAYWDANADYVWSGSLIRFPQGRVNTFSIAPVARYIAPATTLSASTAPTLMPPHARVLLVYRAAAQFAAQGGMRDPEPYYDLERRAWLGNPEMGDVGLLGALKLANPWLGGAALLSGTGGILDGVSTGAGYRGLAP